MEKVGSVGRRRAEAVGEGLTKVIEVILRTVVSEMVGYEYRSSGNVSPEKVSGRQALEYRYRKHKSGINASG